MDTHTHSLISSARLRHASHGAVDALASSFAASYAGVVAFLAVADEGSFARAGVRLGIGRSAVSRSVQKLETQLDARLFQRTTRSTSLTREGELFYANCQPGVERIMHAMEDMHELRSGPPKGHLRIHSTTGFGRMIVARLLHDFHLRYPGITLELVLNDMPPDFTTDRIDVSFRDGRLEDSDVVARKLMPMQMVLCASPDYVQAHGMPLDVNDLGRHSCINFRSSSGHIRQWQFRIGETLQKFLPQAHCTFNDIDLIVQSVLKGQGIAQLPSYLVQSLLKERKLLMGLEQFAADDEGCHLCYPSRKQLPDRTRVFIEYAVEHACLMDLPG
ncbi:LysR family transcriptional regulator [Pusillimonas sp. MFBS29]|uniref:LysR family transcriptional regulator n=1 Tax=Pusillimonas sp. MFBS29 TaxID=2886690 RepID=UPI001D115D9A|nr:LysR family transcriptional regulator [Pusillimonas sp. MFBS29]MCC2596620.1 LysR family transcriptional regulator [Pusillimonas sp. MFBS29]